MHSPHIETSNQVGSNLTLEQYTQNTPTYTNYIQESPIKMQLL